MQNPRVLDLLAQGLLPSQVLSIVGISPNYLKELIENEEFKKELENKKQEYYKEADEEAIIGNKYLSLEHKILKQIEAQIGSAELRDNIRALEVVSSRQEKSKTRQSHAEMAQNGAFKTTNVNNIVLNLPMHAIPEYVLNSNKEVVAIDNVGMAPMTGNNVKSLFDAMRSGEKLVQIA